MQKTAVNMERLMNPDSLQHLFQSKKKLSYTYSVEKVNGEVTEYTDPYAFANVTKTGRLQSISCRRKRKMQHIYSALMKELSMA